MSSSVEQTFPDRRLSGLIPPLVTPLTDSGEPDIDSLARLIDHVFDEGASGIFLLGSTGEGTSFGVDRRSRLLSAAVGLVGDRGPVLAGLLAPGTDQVIELCAAAIEAGASGLVAAAPFYVSTHPAEIEAHFRAIAGACGDVGLLAYNIPSHVGTPLPADVLLRLAADNVIAGVKDSSGSLPGLRKLLDGRRELGLDSFSVLTGSEVTADLSVLLGVDGIIPGLGNVDPGTFVRLMAAVRAGEWEKAELEQQRILGLFDILGIPDRRRLSGSSAAVGAVKSALQTLGVIDSRRPAPPLMAVDESESARIREVLIKVGVLQVAP